MAITKILTKLIKAATKKKKKHSEKNPRKKESTYLSGKGKSKKPKPLAKPKNLDKSKPTTGGKLKGPRTRSKEELRKILGEPKNTKAEKVVGKRKPKPKVPSNKFPNPNRKKSIIRRKDGSIVGSGDFSSRPPGSKGKASVKADSPRGGTTGLSMKDARKKQMRDTADLGSEMKRLGRKYDDLPKGVKRTIIMAIKSRDPKKITSAFKGTNMTRAEFVKVHNKRLGGR